MSAFIVEDAHIDALVTFAVSGQRISTFRKSPDEIGQTLVNENWRSVNYRYKTTDTAPVYQHAHYAQPLTIVEVLKACDCYEYQACETTDYNDSEAANLIHAIRKKAIREMPGYQEAPWGIETNSTRSQPKRRLRAVG